MKFIYIHTLDLNYSETSETFVIYNVLSLAQFLESIELVLINRGSKKPADLIKEKFDLDHIPENLKITDYPLRTHSKLPFYLFVRKYIKSVPKDVLVITRAHGVLRWLFFYNRPAQKVFFETHDYFFDLSRRVDVGKKGRNKKSRIERKYFRKLSGIISSNDYQATLYAEHFPKLPVKSFPTGLLKVHRVTEQRTDRIAYIGTLEPRLGMDRVINLIEYIDSSVEIIIIGGRGEKDINQFKSLFPEHKLPKNVRITGWLKKKELYEILRTIKIGLLPLYADQNRFALPLKIFDYFAFGIPVLSTRLPAIENIIVDEKTGYYVDWESPRLLAEKINRILNNDQIWTKLSENVYEKANSMKWEQRAMDQVRFLKEMISKDV